MESVEKDTLPGTTETTKDHDLSSSNLSDSRALETIRERYRSLPEEHEGMPILPVTRYFLAIHGFEGTGAPSVIKCPCCGKEPRQRSLADPNPSRRNYFQFHWARCPRKRTSCSCEVCGIGTSSRVDWRLHHLRAHFPGFEDEEGRGQHSDTAPPIVQYNPRGAEEVVIAAVFDAEEEPGCMCVVETSNTSPRDDHDRLTANGVMNIIVNEIQQGAPEPVYVSIVACMEAHEYRMLLSFVEGI